MYTIHHHANKLNLESPHFIETTKEDEQLGKIQKVLENVDVESINAAMDAILTEKDASLSKLMADKLREKVSPNLRNQINGILYFMIGNSTGIELNRYVDRGYFESDRELGHLMELHVQLALELDGINNEIDYLTEMKSYMVEEANDLINQRIMRDLDKRIESWNIIKKEVVDIEKELNNILTGFFGKILGVGSDIEDNEKLEQLRDIIRDTAPRILDKIDQTQKLAMNHQNNLNGDRNKLHTFLSDINGLGSTGQSLIRSTVGNYYKFLISNSKNPPTTSYLWSQKEYEGILDFDEYEKKVKHLKSYSLIENAYTKNTKHSKIIQNTTHKYSTSISEEEIDEAYVACETFDLEKKNMLNYGNHPYDDSPIVDHLDFLLDFINYSDSNFKAEGQIIPNHIQKIVSDRLGIDIEDVSWDNVIKFSRHKVYEFAGAVGSLIMGYLDWKNDRDEASCSPTEVAQTWEKLKEQHPEQAKPFLYYMTRWGMWKDENMITNDLNKIGNGEIRGNSFYDQWLNGAIMFSTMAKALYVLKDRPESIQTVTNIIKETAEEQNFSIKDLRYIETLQNLVQKGLSVHHEELGKFIEMGLVTDEHSVSTLLKTILTDGENCKNLLTGLGILSINIQNDPNKLQKFSKLFGDSLKEVNENKEDFIDIIQSIAGEIDKNPNLGDIISSGSRAVIDMMNTHPKSVSYLLDILLQNPDLATLGINVGKQLDKKAGTFITESILQDPENTEKLVQATQEFTEHLENHPRQGDKLKRSINKIAPIITSNNENIANDINKTIDMINSDPERQKVIKNLVTKGADFVRKNPDIAAHLVNTATTAGIKYYNFLNLPNAIPESEIPDTIDDPDLEVYKQIQNAKSVGAFQNIQNDFSTLLDTTSWLQKQHDAYINRDRSTEKMPQFMERSNFLHLF